MPGADCANAHLECDEDDARDGEDDGKNYIVTSGLHVGDRIVLKGITKLTDGQQIKPITLERYNQKIAEAAKLAESQDNAHAFATAMGGKK